MQSQQRIGFGLLVLATLAIVSAGCGPNVEVPDLAEVTGTVTLDGQPVEGATVAFLSEERGWISLGTTDASGQFQLMYKQGHDGAAPGTHQVTVSTGMTDEGRPGTMVPPRYDDRETSGLTAQVTPEGPNNFTFELLSE